MSSEWREGGGGVDKLTASQLESGLREAQGETDGREAEDWGWEVDGTTPPPLLPAQTAELYFGKGLHLNL